MTAPRPAENDQPESDSLERGGPDARRRLFSAFEALKAEMGIADPARDAASRKRRAAERVGRTMKKWDVRGETAAAADDGVIDFAALLRAA